MNEESEENDEENTNLVESLEVNFTTETNPELVIQNMINTLTDKEIADYLREKKPFIVEQIYRALYNNGGQINSSDITPPPLPLKFMTRALTANVEFIILHWSGGSDEGHLNVNLKDKNGETLSSWQENRPLLRALFADIEEWCYDTMDYGGAGDGSSYGDIIRYNLTEGTVSTETWWTEEVHGGEDVDTLETC
jgi:hypothetical protein